VEHSRVQIYLSNRKDYTIRGAVVFVKTKLKFQIGNGMKMCCKINLGWNSLAKKEQQ